MKMGTNGSKGANATCSWTLWGMVVARLHITKRRQRAFKVVGLTWIVERTFTWLPEIVA